MKFLREKLIPFNLYLVRRGGFPNTIAVGVTGVFA